MINVVLFLTDIRDRGIQIRVEDGNLIVSPKSKLTDADRATLRSSKQAIVRELQRRHTDTGITQFDSSELDPVELAERVRIRIECGISEDEAKRLATIDLLKDRLERYERNRKWVEKERDSWSQRKDVDQQTLSAIFAEDFRPDHREWFEQSQGAK